MSAFAYRFAWRWTAILAAAGLYLVLRPLYTLVLTGA